MQLSFVALALALVASASAVSVDPLVARQADCIAESRATDRFFVARPNRDSERHACEEFAHSCNALDGNGNVKISASCEVSEKNIVRARCVGAFNRGQHSCTRKIAKELGLNLSVDSNGRCNEEAKGKCSKKDFNPEVRTICRH